jgi:transmembrane sensor
MARSRILETERIPTREEIEEAAAAWIARRDGGAWTERDGAAFEAWLAQSAGHRVAYYRLNGAWTQAGRAGTVAPASLASAAPKSRRRLAGFAIAASVLALLCAGAFVLKDELFRTQQRFTTVVGGLQTIPLPDGSRVTLNTDSAIRASLTNGERLVEIDHGEAFFDVAPDAHRPFIVKAGKQRVVVVGTQFSVRQERSGEFHVIVTRGTVQWERRVRDTRSGVSANVSELLPAGSAVQGHGEDVRVQQLPLTDLQRRLTWRTGVLTFRETRLADAVAEFNRYTTRKLVVDDPRIAALEISGVFRSNSVDSFVHLLERGFAVRAAVQPDRIVLTASTGRDRRSP